MADLTDAAKLYFELCAASLRAQLAYRASFLIEGLGTFLVTGVEILAVWALFARFGRLGDWTLAEVALFYGTVETSFALGHFFATGFETFGARIRRGDFDRVLLRPRSPLFQIFAHAIHLRRLGRLVQGWLVLAWAANALGLDWSPLQLLALAAAIVGGACLFVGLFVLQATTSFWTVETLEVFNAFTYGGTFAARYPLTIYAPWFRNFFTYVVPLALSTYFPLLLVLQRSDPLGSGPLLQILAPLGGVAFLVVACTAWKFGVRRYASTGN